MCFEHRLPRPQPCGLLFCNVLCCSVPSFFTQQLRAEGLLWARPAPGSWEPGFTTALAVPEGVSLPRDRGPCTHWGRAVA